MIKKIYPPMSLNDEKISHLEIIGETRREAIENLKSRIILA